MFLDFSSYKNVNIIFSFPSFGFSTNLASQFLIEKNNCESIGHIFLEDSKFNFMTIHKGKPVWPFTVYYSKKDNFLLFNCLINISGKEVEVFNKIKKLLDNIDFKNIYLLEGIASDNDKHNIYYYTLSNKKIKNINFLEEAVILGISSLFFSFYPEKTIGLFSLSNISKVDFESSFYLLKVLKDLKVVSLNVDSVKDEALFLKKYMDSIIKKHSVAKSLKEKDENANYIG